LALRRVSRRIISVVAAHVISDSLNLGEAFVVAAALAGPQRVRLPGGGGE
jgi:hypothetical protein